jgi:DNA primase
MSTPVQKIKEKLSITDVLGQYMKLERVGGNWKGRCPFHNEKTPSFFVTPDRGTYYCFGCHVKGDIFTFVQEFEGTDFMGALKMLAEKAGVPLEYESRDNRDERDRLYEVMEEAASFFEKRLAGNSEALAYVAHRGISPASRQKFRLGYAPSEWRELTNHLRTKKFNDSIIEKAGLAKPGDKGYYDRFRDRIMFPISDSSGRIIAFSGRLLHDTGDVQQAKYINSPDTPLYNKSSVLFGIDKAKHDIRTKGYAILVEGQVDLVLMHQIGLTNTVAVSGTALADNTVDQAGAVNNLGLLKRLTDNVIIAFDGDKAGRNAALRAATIGLSLAMDVKVADFPEGQDPADLVRTNAAALKTALAAAQPIILFMVERMMREEKDRAWPAYIGEHIVPLIVRLNSSVAQAEAIRAVAGRAGIREEALWHDVRTKIAALPKPAGGSFNTTPFSAKIPSLAPASSGHKNDMILRRLVGAFFASQGEHLKEVPAAHIQTEIARIYEKSWEELLVPFELQRHELTLEAELRLPPAGAALLYEINELLYNLEENHLKERYIRLMAELAQAERHKDEARARVLLEECTALAHRVHNIRAQRDKGEHAP